MTRPEYITAWLSFWQKQVCSAHLVFLSLKEDLSSSGIECNKANMAIGLVTAVSTI